MAKRKATKGTKSTRSTATGDALEGRVLAFAEQMGYVAGTLQTKAEGLIDRQALSRQLTSVRDGATSLLKHLASGATALTRRKRASAGSGRARKTGRSGGAVDAPGKKHRKPAPADSRVGRARTQAATMRESQATSKAKRHQARG